MIRVNNNMIAVFAVILLMFAVAGQLFVYKKAGDLENAYRPQEITGKATATGTVSLIVIRPISDIDFHGELAGDNRTVILRWANLNQDNVSIYIADNLTDNFGYGTPNVTGLTVFNWSDPTAGSVPHRYYRLGISRYGLYNLSENIVGKYDIPIKFADGGPATYELNEISFPLIPYNLSFSDIMRWGTPNDVVLRYNTTDIGGKFKGWETNLKLAGGTWLTQFSRMSVTDGYVFPFVQNPYNLTLIGTVPDGTVKVPMVVTNGAPATYEMMLMGWNSLRTECNLASALNTTTPPETMVWFDTTDIGGTYQGWRTNLLLFNGTGYSWFPAGGCMKPGYGYSFLQIGAPYNWTYDRSWK